MKPQRLAGPAALPAGNDIGSTPAWYSATQASALLPGGEALFLQLGDSIFPMLERANTLTALTTPYTVLWQPLLPPGWTDMEVTHIGRAFGDFCRSWATVRLDAMDHRAAWQAPLAEGVGQAGLRILPFDHFGNWHAVITGLDWPAYLAARPGALRESIRRRSRKLMQSEGAAFSVVQGPAGLDEAIAAFETVYAKSWKEPEPYPAFNASLARVCAAAGTLRLGVLSLKGETLAAQLWVVYKGTATVLKLAHDEAHRAHSPGTVLTALMIQHVMEHDQVAALDFGRGDDSYKQLWCDQRRQRIGWVLANPRRPSGLVALARRAGRDMLTTLRGVTSGAAIPRSSPPFQGDNQ